MWKESRRDVKPHAEWNEIVDAFIDHFLPTETRLACATEFENLNQGNMSVWDYQMKFVIFRGTCSTCCLQWKLECVILCKALVFWSSMRPLQPI